MRSISQWSNFFKRSIVCRSLSFLKNLTPGYDYFCYCCMHWISSFLLLQINSPPFLLLYAPGGWIIWTTSKTPCPLASRWVHQWKAIMGDGRTGTEWGQGAIILVHSCWASLIALSLHQMPQPAKGSLSRPVFWVLVTVSSRCLLGF